MNKTSVLSLSLLARGFVLFAGSWLACAKAPQSAGGAPVLNDEGSSHPSARLFALGRAGRHLAVYDPKTEQLTHISTCFGTHHLMFAEDANNTLGISGGGQVVGWLNTRLFDETGDEERSQGWAAQIRDTNGNGKRDPYVEPDQPVDPTVSYKGYKGIIPYQNVYYTFQTRI